MNYTMSEIPLFEIDWTESDVTNAQRSITRGSHWAKGPFVDEFETKLESYLDVEHAITVNSGTTALVAILHALGITDGDEVIVPSFTFIATANAVRLVGATPVFADIEPHTYGLDPDAVEASLTDDTAAILPVHVYGTSCRITELVQLAEEHDVALIEDAAEALGATYGTDYVGTFGDAGMLSFCQNKIIATGEGGAIVTDNDQLAERIELYRSHGRASSDYFERATSGEYTDLGTNIRMPDLTAAVGSSQMDRIDSLIERRQEVAREYNRRFADIDALEPHRSLEEGTHVHQLYTIELDESVNRERLIAALDQRDIASKVYWDPPVHQTTYYQQIVNSQPELPVTERIADRVLSLPMHPNLTTDEIERIVTCVSNAIDS